MYEPSRHISSFHIAGFQHYEGAMVLESMKPGGRLEMEPEFDNPHDRILQVDSRKDPWKQVLVGLYVRDAR